MFKKYMTLVILLTMTIMFQSVPVYGSDEAGMMVAVKHMDLPEEYRIDLSQSEIENSPYVLHDSVSDSGDYLYYNNTRVDMDMEIDLPRVKVNTYYARWNEPSDNLLITSAFSGMFSEENGQTILSGKLYLIMSLADPEVDADIPDQVDVFNIKYRKVSEEAVADLTTEEWLDELPELERNLTALFGTYPKFDGTPYIGVWSAYEVSDSNTGENINIQQLDTSRLFAFRYKNEDFSNTGNTGGTEFVLDGGSTTSGNTGGGTSDWDDDGGSPLSGLLGLGVGVAAIAGIMRARKNKKQKKGLKKAKKKTKKQKNKVPTTDQEILDAWNTSDINEDASLITDSDVRDYEAWEKGEDVDSDETETYPDFQNDSSESPSTDDVFEDAYEEEDTDDDDKEKPKLILSDSNVLLVKGKKDQVRVRASVIRTKLDYDFELAMDMGTTARANIEVIDGRQVYLHFEVANANLGFAETCREFSGQIIATGDENAYSRDISLVVGQEGLFLDSEEPVKIIADAETVTDLRFTATRVHDNHLITDFRKLDANSFQFEFKADDPISANAFEAADINFEVIPELEGLGRAADNYDRNNTFVTLNYSLKTKNPLPSGKNKDSAYNSYKGTLAVTSLEDPDIQEWVDVELLLPAEPPESQKIEDEYIFTKNFINKYVPEKTGYREKFLDLLEKNKMVWGSKGIYEFRHKMWRTAQKLWEAEGLQGYVDIQKQIERYDEIRSWVEWMGDIALSVVLNVYTSPGVGGAATQMVIEMFKDTLKSLINHYKDTVEMKGKFTKKDIDVWQDQQLEQLLFSSPDRLVSVASMKGIIKGPKMFMYMLGVMFLRGLFTDKGLWQKWGELSVADDGEGEVVTDLFTALYRATKEFAKGMSTTLIVMFLTKHTIKSAIRHNQYIHEGHTAQKPIKVDRDVQKQFMVDEYKRKNIPVKQNRTFVIDELPSTVKALVNNAKNGAASLDDVIKCLKDTEYNTMRSLKNAPKSIQKLFTKTYKEKLLKPHDQHIIKHLQKQTDVPWGTKIIDGKPTKALIKIFETSGSDFSQDRDYVPKYLDQHGNWREIKTSAWLSESNGWWKKNTGFDAETLQQMGMTKNGSEAFSGYATEGYNSKTGKYETFDPHMKKVYEGKAKLKDGIGYGACTMNKVKGANCPAEAIAQLKKGVISYEKVEKSHIKQGYNVPKKDLKVSLAMEAIKLAPDDHMATPEVIGKINGLLSEHTGFTDYMDFARELQAMCGKL